MSLLDYTAVELAAKIKAGETTATEAMEAVIAQIEKSEDELNCYVTFDKEKALAAAKKADEDIKAGKLTGPLAGVPLQSKIICVQRACLLHAHLRYLVISFQLTQQTLQKDFRMQEL